MNVADAGSRRLHRVNFVGLVQPTGMQETEAFSEGEGVKATWIQVSVYFSANLLLYNHKRNHRYPAVAISPR
ncbi:MAG TPA: hypothetical protein PK036_13125 [Geobacteraceae bacterium]|nr:hypothetical protein [Geobacteraceae bacterium]